MARGITEKEMRLAAKKMRLQYGVIEILITECRKIRGAYAVNKTALRPDISEQRQLLIDFADWFTAKDGNEAEVDAFLENNE